MQHIFVLRNLDTHTQAECYETALGVAHKQSSNGNTTATTKERQKQLQIQSRVRIARTCLKCVCVCVCGVRGEGVNLWLIVVFWPFSNFNICDCPTQLTVHKLSAHHTLIGHIHTPDHTPTPPHPHTQHNTTLSTHAQWRLLGLGKDFGMESSRSVELSWPGQLSW